MVISPPKADVEDVEDVVTLKILAFNDVYRVKQRYVPQPGAPEDQGTPAPSVSDSGGEPARPGDDPASRSQEGKQISVSQFGELLLSERAKWADRWASTSGNGGEDGNEQDAEKDGLVLFAGDVFNPSVESSVTRGSHMVGPKARRS
jgi:hypothetical protein